MVSQPFHYLTAKLQKKAIQSSFLGGKIEFYGYFLTYLMFYPLIQLLSTSKNIQKSLLALLSCKYLNLRKWRSGVYK